MTICPLFLGAELYYNDMHLVFLLRKPRHQCGMSLRSTTAAWGVTSAVLGQIAAAIWQQGILRSVQQRAKSRPSCFPLRHYHGITILLDLDAISPEMWKQMEWYGVDLDVIRRYICTENRCCILRSEPTIAHIFSELYTAHSVPDTGYLRLKVLELLHILTRLKTGKMCSRQTTSISIRWSV